MGVYYDFVLEAKIDGTWHGIIPEFPTLPRDKDSQNSRNTKNAANLFWSRCMQDFMGDAGSYGIGYSQLSEETKNYFWTKERQEEIEKNLKEGKTGWYIPQLEVIDSGGVRCMYREAEKEYDVCGYVRKETAEEIRNGADTENIWPVDLYDVLRNLQENDLKADGASELFDRFYEEVKFVRNNGYLDYCKFLTRRISALLAFVNTGTGRYFDDFIESDDCRIIIYIH